MVIIELLYHSLFHMLFSHFWNICLFSEANNFTPFILSPDSISKLWLLLLPFLNTCSLTMQRLRWGSTLSNIWSCYSLYNDIISHLCKTLSLICRLFHFLISDAQVMWVAVFSLNAIALRQYIFFMASYASRLSVLSLYCVTEAFL